MPTIAEIAVTTGIVASLGLVGYHIVKEASKDKTQQQVAKNMKGVNIPAQPTEDTFAKT